MRLQQFKVALQMYHLEYGRFPSGDDAAVIAALTAATNAPENPRGIRFLWLEQSRRFHTVGPSGAFLDGWGNPVGFEWSDNRDAVLLRSAGKDGLRKTADDVTVSIGERIGPEPSTGR